MLLMDLNCKLKIDVFLSVNYLITKVYLRRYSDSMKRSIMKVEKNDSGVIINPIMSLCFFEDSLSIIKSIKRTNSDLDEIYMLGVKYCEQSGDDIQFAITGKVARDNKGQFIEDNDYAMERELAEELGLCVNDNISRYRYENILKEQQQELEQREQRKNSKDKIAKSNSMMWYLSDCNMFFKKSRFVPAQVPAPKRVFNSVNIHSFRANRLDNIFSRTGKESETKLTSSVPSQEPQPNYSLPQRSYSSVVAAAVAIDDTKLATRTITATTAASTFLSKRKPLYQAYLFDVNICSPLKRYTELKLNNKQIQQKDISPKVCAYIYGSKDEINDLINNISYMFEDADDIEAFVVIKLDDVLQWLNNLKTLEAPAKTIFDKRLKTNFTVESHNFIKCSL